MQSSILRFLTVFVLGATLHNPVFAQSQSRVWADVTPQELIFMANFILRVVPEHGLYLTPSEEQLIERLRMAKDLEALRPTVISLYKMTARQIYSGRLIPTKVSPDIRFAKKTITDENLRKMLFDSKGSMEQLIFAVAPKFADYRMLLKLLSRLRNLEMEEPWGKLEIKKALKFEMSQPVVVKVKRRLVALGFTIDSMDERFDEQTVAAINDIQRQNKSNPDGILSPNKATQKYLETPLIQRIEQVRADLEKIRWLPQEPKPKYIFVNLAFSSFLLVDFSRANPVVFNFKTINGRVKRKTPSMVDRIHQVVFNPFWTVPKTIFIEDKIPLIQDMTRAQMNQYFQENNYIVVSSDYRRRLDPNSINWWRVESADSGFFIRQLPNYFNALGVVRFSLTNKEAIFLHDTGERELFFEENRILSSGCVRLEKPIELAEYLLAGTNWDRYAIENTVTQPGEVLEKETPVTLKTPMEVYLLPVTSHLSADGVMRFTTDVYGHNESIRSQLNSLFF
ncbi:MAG: L,D-transpeptidase family protein [Pseudobdellovibrionaceae bacterium]